MISERDVRRLTEALIHLDDTGPAEEGLAALARLVARPRMLARVEEFPRSCRVEHANQPVNGFDRLIQRFDRGSRRPIAVALASLSGDGRRREGAVRAILEEPHPALVPFLVIRTGDWAGPVREPARAGLALLLSDRPEIFLPVVVPVARRYAGRFRGAYADAQAMAAVLAAPDDVRRALAGSRSVLERRLGFDADRLQERLSTADLAAIAMREHDSVIRSRASGAACREAVWRRDAATLRGLAGARWSDVRASALTGLARLGLDAEVAERALDDPAALVRPIGRAAARRAGLDEVAHYRAAVVGSPAPGAVAGLGEAGSGRDAELLRPLLGAAGAKVRAAAVRALVALSAVPVEEVLPLLRDPAAAVVREAALALRPYFRLLPAGLSDELMADPRPEVRLAGYRLVGHQDAATRFAAALTLSRDARFAGRGRDDVVRLAHWAANRWSYDGRSARELLSTSDGADVEAAVEVSRPALGSATDDVLALLRRPHGL